MPIEFFQITAAYSNAVLVAIIPHFADFAKKLDLPTLQPITQSQVLKFNCFPRSDHIGGRVILTNGCEFIFDHGHVENFVSPRSFFYLQNPDSVPRFYGPVKLSQEKAVQVAHDAIKKLGFNDAMLSADRAPEVTSPERDGTNYIARYRIRWRDMMRGGNPNNRPISAEFEVDATSGRIQMVNIRNPNAYGPDLSLDVRPPVSGEAPKGSPLGPGRILTPVSLSYSNAFLAAILPQCSQYAKTAGVSVKLPLETQDVDQSTYQCGLVDGDPMASFKLNTGAQFIYRHGQVIAFYAADVMTMPGKEGTGTYPDIDRERAKYFGPINMMTNEVIALVRETLKNLGYSEKTIHVDRTPNISGPGWWGTNRVARCEIVWSEKTEGPTYVNAEVDVAKKKLTSLYVNDHANTNIWRKPPKIPVAP